MKICSIHIKGFQQFEDLYLDFTNPATGEPVDKVCFIGRNGTGKSTLLGLVDYYLLNFEFGIHSKKYPIHGHISPSQTFVRFRVKVKYQYFDIISFIVIYKGMALEHKPICLNSLERIYESLEGVILDENLDLEQRDKYFSEIVEKYKVSYENKFSKSIDLIITSPVDDSINSKQFNETLMPDSNLNNALSLISKFPTNHVVNNSKITNFWTILIYHLEIRRKEKEEFETKPENIDKSKRQLIEEFDKISPKILDKIAILWNKILDRAGLEFDVEGAKVPVQLTDNLHAYIRHKKTKEIIHYSQLSTGIRNFIFRIGHIYSLYFNREIKRGFLLVDEPENSLFPDFLFELMELYDEIIEDKNGEKNTQMFFATHSPIVAAQFQPYERIVLEWDDEGKVTSHKGISPIGDDPNDVLVNDFQLDHLMGREGQEMWNKYLGLQKALRNETDPSQKQNLLLQLNKIGKDYNFE